MDVPLLKAMPILNEEAAWLWNAFETLSEKRVFAEHGPHSITMNEILAYALFTGVDGEDSRDDLLRAVTNMDRLWMDDMRTKIAHRRKSTPPGRRGGGRQRR